MLSGFCAIKRLANLCATPTRTLWKWPPGSIAKIEKISSAFYSYNPKHLLEKDRSPVVCLHGLYSSKEHFLGLAPDLAKRLRTVCYSIDMRNHGESGFTAFDDKATLMVLAQDLRNFFDEFGINRGILIGQGLGGRVMAQFAQLNPVRVDSLILIDPSSDGTRLYSKSFPKNLKYLKEVQIAAQNNNSNSVSYARLVMKEVLRGHVKNPITLQFLLEQIQMDKQGNFKFKFNDRVLEKVMTNWSQVAQINYCKPASKSKIKLLNIITKGNFISSEDYLDFKKAFGSCQVDHVNSRIVSKPTIINAIEKFALSQ